MTHNQPGPLPEFHAPRNGPPPASRTNAETWPKQNGPRSRESAETWPRHNGPHDRPHRRDRAARNRYRTAVAEQVARESGHRPFDPAPSGRVQHARRAEALAFINAMGEADRRRVSSRDVRHLYSRWDLPLEAAYALSVAAAHRRRAEGQ